MPRTRLRKTERGLVPLETWEKAIEECVKDGIKVRTVAKNYRLCHVTLGRKIIQAKNGNLRFGYNPATNVFLNDEERAPESRFLTNYEMCYGLPSKDCRKLAYRLDIKHQLNYPATWEE